MDQAKPIPSTAQPQKKNKSRVQSILQNRRLVIGIVIGLVVLVAGLGFVVSQRRETDQASEKTYPLAAKEKYIVESVSNNKATLTNSTGKREIEDNKTTLVYQNLPPENKPAKFSDLKPQQEVDVLEIKPNTIVYILGATSEQNITIENIEAKSSVPNRTIQISNPTAFKTQVQTAEWIYNTNPPKNITINLVASPQNVVFISGESGNTISTSAAIDSENTVISLYVNPSYIQNEDSTLLSQFVNAAVLSQIYSAMNPTLKDQDILNKVNSVNTNSQLLVLK